MRVLCCLDGTNIEQITHALTTLLHSDTQAVGLLYVTDQGPHEEMERLRMRHLRPHELRGPRREQMQQAEQAASQDILNEGQRFIPGSELLSREGRPEREIVNCAVEWNTDLIMICPRSPGGTALPPGPKSVGHIARFVLDHAPCPVLLIRPITRNQVHR
jgi:nucleotide-binding universal stress UspA family protein